MNNRKALWWILGLVALAGSIYYICTALGFFAASSGENTGTSTQIENPKADLASDEERHLLLGRWRSNTDQNFTREFRADQSVVDRYRGDEAATATGTWSVITDASREAIPLPTSAGITILKIEMGESMYFTIQELNDQALLMTYLQGAGNAMHSYERVPVLE